MAGYTAHPEPHFGEDPHPLGLGSDGWDETNGPSRVRHPCFLYMVGCWMVIGIYHTAHQYGEVTFTGVDGSLLRLLAYQLIKSLLWALFTVLLLRYPDFFPQPVSRRTVLGIFVPTGIGITTISVGVDYVVASFLHQRHATLDSLLYSGFHRGLLDAVLVLGTAYGMRAHELATERATRTATLESQLTRAQMRALHAQIQPHFLFNTLHSISTLLNRRPDQAERMITLLSDLLRAALDTSEQQLVPLGEEILFVRRYLDIQQIRFSDRLRIEWHVGRGATDCLVPPFLLQPLVENSLKHGIARSENEGTIRIVVDEHPGQLVISVSDDGQSGDGDQEFRSDGVGISNIRARLAKLFGERATLLLEKDPVRGMTVTISIPAVRR